jgi:DNA-binding GntR family transcriptional regulator
LRSRPQLAKAVALNQRLHFAIYRAAKSPMLVEIIAGLWLKAGPIINLDLRESPDRLKSGGAVRFHARALAALRHGDSDGAREAVAADIKGASDFIIARGALRE